MENAAIYARAGWFQATARQRIAGLLDPNSFTEFLGPTERVQSPHLHLFDLPSAFDDGVIVGRGKLDGKDVLVAAQEGQFMGGTFAELMRAIAEARCAGVAVIALVGGKAGAFGGAGLTVATCSRIAISGHGR